MTQEKSDAIEAGTQQAKFYKALDDLIGYYKEKGIVQDCLLVQTPYRSTLFVEFAEPAKEISFQPDSCAESTSDHSEKGDQAPS